MEFDHELRLWLKSKKSRKTHLDTAQNNYFRCPINNILYGMYTLHMDLYSGHMDILTRSQTQTVHSEETVTNWIQCALMYYPNLTDLNVTCQTTFPNWTLCACAQEVVSADNLSCANETRTLQEMSLVRREGMNVLGIIVFAACFAVVLARLGQEGRRVVELVSTLNTAIMRLVIVVMW